MLTDAAVDRELATYRRRLMECASLYAAGRRETLAALARVDMEDMIFLAEEVPDHRRAECEYLVERYESLLQRLMH